jgi:hypothetical protein
VGLQYDECGDGIERWATSVDAANSRTATRGDWSEHVLKISPNIMSFVGSTTHLTTDPKKKYDGVSEVVIHTHHA